MAATYHNKKGNRTTGANLPDELVEKIISYIPIKMATRAALVSRRFINSWRLSRDLYFDTSKQYIFQATFIGVIDRVVSQHTGPKIERFVLKINPTGHENRINEWIQMAVAKGVEVLELSFFASSQKFQISSDLIDVESIRVLKLQSCDPQFSMHLNGLRFLKVLQFLNIYLTISLLGSITSNCLLLEDMELVNCKFDLRMQFFSTDLKNFRSLKVVHFEEIHTISINAPSLETLSYSGDACSFFFVSPCPKLNVATFNFGPRFQQLPGVEHLVTSLHTCKKLNICSKILEGLSPKFRDNQYIDFPFSFSKLKDFSLILGGSNYGGRGTTFVNPWDIIYFLKNCPELNKIDIDLGDNSFEEGFYWHLMVKERFEECFPPFQFLKSLRVNDFKYRNLEFQLVKKIVENAPILEEVTLIKGIRNSQTLGREIILNWMSLQRCKFNIVENPKNRRSSISS